MASANANSPKGTIDDGDRRYQIYTNDQATKAADYAPLVIAYRNGAAVLLSDVANVLDSVEDVRNLGLSNGQPSVLIILFRQPGANIIDTIDSVKAQLPHLEAAMPADVNVTIAIDRSTTIRQSLHDTEVTLVTRHRAGDGRRLFFPAQYQRHHHSVVAVPVSILGTFGAMYLLGYSLDILSLMALTIATGFVVDDAIVVLENVSRHLEAGMPRLQAALLGAREVGFTVLSISLSLIAVFLPILLMGGIVGRLFREFTLTLSLAIIISLAISLTTTPMMCALFLRGSRAREGRSRNHLFDRVLAGYERSLSWALQHSRIVLAIFFGAIILNVVSVYRGAEGIFSRTGHRAADRLAASRPKRVVSADDAKAAADDGDRAARSGGRKRRRLYRRRLWRRLRIDQYRLGLRVAQTARASGRRSIRSSRGCDRNSPKSRAAGCFCSGFRTSAPAAGRATPNTSTRCNPTTPTSSSSGRSGSCSQLEHSKIMADVSSDQQQRGLESDLVIDRDTASRLGITPAQIDNTLYDAFGQRQVSVIYSAINQYHVVMEIDPRYTQYPASLGEIYVATSGGGASGTQTSNAPAGTVTPVNTSSAGAASTAETAAATANNNSARNAAINALANTGKGSTSSGAAVSTAQETMIPLAAVSHYNAGNAPLSVNHQGLFVASTISFNLQPGAALGDAAKEIDDAIRQIRMPASIHGSFRRHGAGVSAIARQRTRS